MTPRQKQVHFRAAIKNAVWRILGVLVVGSPGWMFLHWLIVGYK